MELPSQKSCIRTTAGQEVVVPIEESTAVPLKEVVVSIKEWFQANAAEYSKKREAPIPRAATMLPETNEGYRKYFEPTVVSIGPYHHRNEKLRPMEDLKKRLAFRFVEDRDSSDVQKLYTKLHDEIGNMRKFYDGELIREYDDDKYLTRMMLVDGLFLLHYIYCFSRHTLQDLDMKNEQIIYVGQDLFLLENQLPFRVLQLLSDGLTPKYDLTSIIKIFIQHIITMPQSNRMQQQKDWLSGKLPVHLLGYKQIGLLGSSKIEENSPSLLRLVQKIIPASSYANWIEDFSPRSATELKAMGIHLKPSETNYLMDVSFTSLSFIYGELRLPPIIIKDSTIKDFLNLIAFEMCADEVKVISFIYFLNSLICHRDDVKALRDANILQNFLGSDDDVVKLFTEMTAELDPAEDDLYREVKGQIGQYLGQRKRFKLPIKLVQGIASYSSKVTILTGAITLSLKVVSTIQGDKNKGGVSEMH